MDYVDKSQDLRPTDFSRIRPNLSVTDSTPSPDNEAAAPAHLLTDYIEVVYLPVAVCVGTFFNIFVFKRLWNQWHRSNIGSGQRKSYLLLKFNLNIADLMVLLIYAFGRFCWVVAYQWHGGDFLCRAYHFLSLTAFHMTAFVMMTIAVDRLRAIYSTVVLKNKKKRSIAFVRNMLVLCWTLAFGLSLGQWWIWQAFSPPYEIFQAKFVQCTTMWEVRKVQNDTVEAGGFSETTYTLIHLLSAFWIPLSIIAICYTLVCIRYLNHVLSTAGRLRRNKNPENVQLTATRSCEALPSPDSRLLHTEITPSGTQLAQENGRRHVKTRGLHTNIFMKAQPAAGGQCKSKVFRTSGLVVLCYLCCWFPYNLLALWKVVDTESYYPLSERLNILNALIVLNSVFNPLIYGFH